MGPRVCRICSGFGFFVLLVAWFGVGGSAQAGEPLESVSLTSARRVVPPTGPRLAQERRVSVLVELSTPSAATSFRGGLRGGPQAAKQASKRAVAAATTQTNAVMQRIKRASPGVREIFRSSRLLSGVAVEVAAQDLAALRRTPGVRQVRVLVPKRTSHTVAVPLIKAPQLWAGGAPGSAGSGVTIGIIDTGIDYTHAHFGGPGTVAAFTAASGSSTFVPTAKVVGGWDFAGDAYNPQNPATAVPVPDGNPLDCDGHGTHVAGTVAGYGVTGSGAPYGTGVVSDYSGAASTPSWFSQFGPGVGSEPLGIGPGVAPLASLYALKVFGCTPSTNLVIPALERAADPNGDGDISDHLDIVNMSLGGDFASPQDPDAVAANNAVAAGITVVASMGNVGDAYDAGASPANASKVIAVAATDSADQVAGFSSRGRRTAGALKPDLAAPGVAVVSAAVGTGNGGLAESGTSMAAPMVAGSAALVAAAHPTWTPEEIKAALMNHAQPDLRISGGASSADLGRIGAGRVDVAAAASATSVAYSVSDPGAVSLSFPPVAAVADSTAVKGVRLVNKSEIEQTYQVAIQDVGAVPGVTYRTSLDGTELVTVPAAQSIDFTVEVAVSRVSLRRIAPPGLTASYPLDLTGTPVDTPRAFATQALARLEITPSQGPVLRVPIATTVRPASAITTGASGGTFPVGTVTSTAVSLSGLGLDNGVVGQAGRVQARGQGFGLAASSAQLPACPAVTDCLPVPDAAAGDLRYVGVTSNAKPVLAPTALTYDPRVDNLTTFALSTWGPWATPASFAEFSIHLDTDRNGSAEYVLFNTRTAGNEDIFVAQLDRVFPDGSRVPLDIEPINGLHASGNSLGYGGVDTAVMDSDTLTMPFFTGLLGSSSNLAPGSRFDYWVTTDTVETGPLDRVGSATARLTFDALRPAIVVAPSPVPAGIIDQTYPEVLGQPLVVTKNASSYALDRTQGQLFVHFHNLTGSRAEVRLLRQAQSLTVPAALANARRQSAGAFKPGIVASSGLPVTLSTGSSAGCTTTAGFIYPKAAGYCTVTATQTGSATFAAATSVARTFVMMGVTKASIRTSDSTVTTTQPVTITGQITRNSASATSLSGTARLYDGTRLLAYKAISSTGAVTFALPTRARGTHYLRIVYYGSTWYEPSTSASIAQYVS